MIRLLVVILIGLAVTSCQTTTNNPISERAGSSVDNINSKIIMKDTRPRGLGSREGGVWNQDMPTSPWVYNLTNVVPARSGELSQRFELRNGDCTTNQPPGDSHSNDWGCYNQRERAEVQHTQWRPGQDKWIGFSLRVDDEWTKSQRDHCTSIFQIKQTENNVRQGNRPETKSGDFSGGHYIGGHAVMHGQICGDKIGVAIKRTGFKDSKFNGWERTENIHMERLSNIEGDWTDIMMRWDTSDYRNGNSKLEIYVNGKKAGEWANITSNFFPDLYTFKYGMYRSYMTQWNVTSDTQVIYYDEVRVGRSFDAVNPATNSALD